MSELEQANKILAQAETVLEQSTQNLEKSQTFNELMVEQNRLRPLALSNLLPKQYVLTLNPCEEKQFTELAKAMKSGSFEVIAEELAENFKQREAFDIVHAINVLAMANTDVIQVIACFSGNINEFFVNAFDAPDDLGEYVEIFRKSVTLSDEDALEKLLAIESQLTELIIEAREEAEAKAEVEA
ncbi:hypothetical protein AB4455_05545 [Vibrio sp. 10N.261.46.E12]|uniref:hypothetical protein n=1 Tax=unclassified Vibrio TaxID=2614977 RepID=UPI000977CC33|nr:MULTISPECIES: hypothetical protein [unclassified Vibrio]OMO36311.1 hypothetical protein BH584_04575 [Vibrio sp. 10N.261.45.E1]PMJ23332.1 hypothetical protein BCU27_15590 [Vibrio sp. 10N.286.45.B6]PML95132.1 hypothetical protein BCT66_23370 [Vibrio sp. 10N.261.49.E11]PMM67124.1 hypothetical protein BCT48_16200 [Vibrio sp. 10N.261.46.F12]PMM79956.1 hypothetical protein BCT46_19160 [Vibrio sp. 10N.261.46.E8]